MCTNNNERKFIPVFLSVQARSVINIFLCLGMGEDVHSFRSGPQSSAYLGDIVWDCIEQDVDTMSHGMLTLDRSSVYHAHFLLRLMQKLRAQISQCK